MSGTIELRVFMELVKVFKERNWSIPLAFDVEKVLTGLELMARLDIAEQQVEVIFINGKALLPAEAMIHPGDRVALVPPGTPGPYRVMLGFVKRT